MESVAFPLSDDEIKEFGHRVSAVVQRGLVQTGQSPLSESELARIADVLALIGADEGWRRRFASGGGELAAGTVSGWVERLRAAVPTRGPEFAGLAKQLVKACFQPSPAECRDSYVECDPAGRCRRQELAYDLARLSGAHCVDCPHWMRLAGGEHMEWLGGRWRAGVGDLLRHRDVFLPEDFRALRGWRPVRTP